jgi:hypothetical protein
MSRNEIRLDAAAQRGAHWAAIAGLAFLVIAPAPVCAGESSADDPVFWSAIGTVLDEPAPEQSPLDAAAMESAADAPPAVVSAETPEPQPAADAAEPGEGEKAPSDASTYEDDVPVGRPMTSTRPRYAARLKLQYEHRVQGEDEDNDFYGYFYASAKNLNKGRFDFYTSMRLKSDLDDATPNYADDPYYSVDDSDGVTEDRVLQLYGDFHDRYKDKALRVGRQYIEVSDYIQLDGAQVTLFENDVLGGRIYAGHPVSYYTSVSGDFAGGISLVGKPWEGNRLRLTVADYEDDSEDGSDQNYFVDLRQRFNDETRARGQVSVLNGDLRFGRADLFHTAQDGSTDFSMGGSYWGEFSAETRVYSPLYEVLGESQPYALGYARLTQEVVPTFLVSPGVSLRFADSGGNDYNNRDYENVDLTFIYEPDRSFSASLAFEYWAVEDDDSFTGITGDLRYRHGRIWEVSGGASYAQYTYDTYSDISYTSGGGQTVFYEGGTVVEETPYVYTYFIRGKWKPLKKLTLRAQFDVEDDESVDDLAYRARGSVEVRY